ncbi:MAG: hypothetical protein LV468_03545 [Candidatus Nitrosotenuis sp.]|uniref:hypothetical protein n=1 Tax=Candidatus Nitrosotenuis cloacae TaxID=1603555 RepID=UPI002281C8AF|nr:hypothetical protein [Candidatus Nitrosotenuis cloacae]MDC8438056.1 hypothetical protein [Candidatus Nitrosotenuis sp.]
MVQFFSDDVDQLIRSGHGDQERLSKIKADYAAKKLVTLEDRKYVESLMSRYFGPAKTEQPKAKPAEGRIVPPPAPKPQDRFEMKHQKAKEEARQIPKISQKKGMRNVIVSVAAVSIAVLVISFVAMNEDQFKIGIGSAGKSIELDQESYFRGDIISVSGKTKTATNTVNIVISNGANEQIWSETVKVKSGGEYSTLIIAGGTGWEQAGTYTASAVYGDEIDQSTFEFSPEEATG